MIIISTVQLSCRIRLNSPSALLTEILAYKHCKREKLMLKSCIFFNWFKTYLFFLLYLEKYLWCLEDSLFQYTWEVVSLTMIFLKNILLLLGPTRSPGSHWPCRWRREKRSSRWSRVSRSARSCWREGKQSRGIICLERCTAKLKNLLT